MFIFRSLLLPLLLCGHAFAQSWDAQALVKDARAQIGVTTGYDPAYRQLDYPLGDVDAAVGVCTDVVIRALRGQKIDLQQLVHEDMRANFSRYPDNWGLKRPDRNIDHRRVPNLQTYLRRHAQSLPPGKEARQYLPGDIVTWRLPGNLPHIGIVSTKYTADGVPLIIHNIGQGTREENILFRYEITGHYRSRE